MRIAIIGPGAMGSLFGAYLIRAGHELLLIDHNPIRARTIGQAGLCLHEGEEVYRFAVKATAAPAPPTTDSPYDLILVMVKAPHTKAAAEAAALLAADNTPVLTLQNGLGGADILCNILGEERVLVGVTSQGATLLGPGEVRHGGAGETIIGPAHPSSKRAVELARMFTEAGLPARWEDSIFPYLWKKLCANCGINAITALTNIKNGKIPAQPEAAALCSEAVRETVRVAKASGVELGDEEELVSWVLSVAAATAANRSSMGQDVDRQKLTEVDFINGAVVREGALNNIATPINETLFRLVKILEKNFNS
ncbi:MAG: 2-dehydropantoate 2-reductase [Deltaproteobacteria bacterium]|nr:MAG: 2-dehydropantoate 2-reductase [Deltaproteobacteria bacterium]